MKPHLLRLTITHAAFSLCFASSAAFAELGNAPSYSTPNDQVIARQTIPPTAPPSDAELATDRYQIVQTTLNSATLIQEYTSSAGTVFGIAWSGKQLPDLRTLLGPTYFPIYLNALEQRNRAPHGLHDPVLIHTDTLVVESAGHPNAFFGRAYLPQALSQLNVSEALIQLPQRSPPSNRPATHR